MYEQLLLKIAFKLDVFLLDLNTFELNNYFQPHKTAKNLIFSIAEKKRQSEILDCKGEELCESFDEFCSKSKISLGLINPIACMLYIIRPSIKLPIAFTKSVPSCASTYSQSKNLHIP
jgi:hypothetical protein